MTDPEPLLIRRAECDAFLLDGQARGWSDQTTHQYRRHLVYWHQYQAGSAVTATTLRLWVVNMRSHWSPATIRSAVISVRCYLRWLERQDLADVLTVPQTPPRVQRTVTANEVARLLREAETPPTRGLTYQDAQIVAVRNGAIVALLFDGWLRAGELCRLNLCAVNLEDRRCAVMGKGNREELVAFGASTARRLAHWIELRRQVAGPGVGTLFVSVGGNTPGQALTREGLQRLLRELGRRTGIDGVSPHAFRRGGATQAIRNGASTRWVQRQGRWSKLDMVERYTRVLEVGEQFEKYSPVNSLGL